MSSVHIELDEKKLKKLVIDYLVNTTGNLHIEDSDVTIQVKSKQNYKSEWENASFKAVYHKVF